MSHLVLARKYRPRNFSDVVGQDSVVSTLKAAIVKDRVAHAMLFTGGRGIGKTTIARIVAKALVCLNRRDADPCGSCSECVSIDNFSSLDVIEIDGASHTGVDDIRELRDGARYQPASAKYKIFIIDEVHMLSISAFNALLKILEEPPAHVMFIFATTEAHKIPKTILSRCQRYDFKRMSIDTIAKTLKTLASRENLVIEDAGFYLIASLADGALRDALSLTEQIVSTKEDHYSAEFIAQRLGVVSHNAVKEICQNLLDAEVYRALFLVKEIYEKGLDLCQLLDAIVERFRVLSLIAHVDEKNAEVLIPSLDDHDFALVKNYDKADLKRLFAMAIDAVPQVFQSHKPFYALELFILRAALRPKMSDAITINYCLKKLDAILHNRPVPKDLPSQDEHKIKSRVIEKVTKKDDEKKDVLTIFSGVTAELQKITPVLASHLRFARPQLDVANNLLTLHFEQTLHYEQVLSYKDDRNFKKVVTTHFGQDLRIVLDIKKSSPDAIKAIKTVAEADDEIKKQEQQTRYERARNDPMVKKALEIFGGEITDVRKVDTDDAIRDHRVK